MRHLRLTGLIAAGSLFVFGLGCPPEEPEPEPPEEAEFDVQMVGENQVPTVATPADGDMDVEFEDETLIVEGSFDGLVAELTEIEGSAAHIHEGSIDEDGPVLYNVDVDANGDNRSGTFEFEQELTDEEMTMFANDELFLNIHTEAYPGGELRGQIQEDAPEYEPVTDSWGIELTPAAHEEAGHEPDTDADGWAWNVLRDDDSFVASGAAHNLTSEVTEVTLEAAEPDEVGDVVFTFEHEMVDVDDEIDDNDDNNNDIEDAENQVRFWLTEELTDDQVDVLEDGNYYINVYTEEFEDDGELRGQIDDDVGFWEDLFGVDGEIDEAPPF